jgi:DNA polymerase (family 10)
MTNLEIASLFRKMAAAYTILGENRFKIIAYDNAATAVEHATSELKDLWDDNKLDSVPGLGSSIISHLDEIFKTGKSKHIESTLSKVNPAIFPLLEVPGIGPKKAEKIVETLGFYDPKTVFADVEKAAQEGKIAKIESFGEKSQSEILAGLDRHKKGSIKEKRMVLPLADSIAEDVINYLEETLGKTIVKIDKLGSLRRQVATIGDIDLAVATNDFEKVLDAFVAFPKKVDVIDRGPTGATLLLSSGRQADLRVSKPSGYGAMLQYFTGSKYHNIRLRDFALKQNLSLNEYGIKKLTTKNKDLVEFGSEEDFYNYLGLDYIPPELREDTGEIDAAKNHTLPKLLELGDIKGDLQMHSNFDLETSHDSGNNSMLELQDAARALNYEFIGITNHNPSVGKHTKDEIITKLAAQKKHIEKLNTNSKMPHIISLLEVDISPDGSLPVPDEGLAQLDGCLVSIHSNFNQTREQMTKRILQGLSHPVARILAHPTGRLLGEREGFEADWEKIFTFCKDHDKAVEINCYPNRLDLPDTLVRMAGKMGLKFSLGTDSHDKDSLINMRYGVSVARRGWLTRGDVLNCQSCDKLLSWFRKRT